MDYLSLKIDSQWAVLDEGTEIALEGNNPLFSDAGSKSYLFRLHVESNRHIFGTSDEIYGESYYKAIDGKRSTLYVMGIPVMTGKIALEDEVMMEDGYVAVNLVSGNLEFAQMIEGVNCREVELLDEVQVGVSLDSLHIDVRYKDSSYGDIARTFDFDLPDEFVFFTDDNPANVWAPYKDKPYCNIRVCSSLNSDTDFNILLSEKYQETLGVTSDASNSYEIFEAGRRSSGLCFYILYFLDCLFKKYNISYQDGISHIEDLTRLAMVNLSCDVKREHWEGGSYNGQIELGIGGDFFKPESPYNDYYYANSVYSFSKVFATSNNFPDEEVEKIISALASAFGVRFIYDSNSGIIKSCLIKDVLLDSEVKQINAEIFDTVKIENCNKGFVLSYNGAEDDLSYNYDDFSDVVVMERYGEIIGAVNANQKSCYVDSRNGNAYRVMVYGDAGDETELYPSLFEVGAFNDARYGDCSDENYIEKIEIPFSPIINNDVGYATSFEKSRSSRKTGEFISDALIDNMYALFIDNEIEHPKTVKVSSSFQLTYPGSKNWLPQTSLHYTYISFQGEDFSSSITNTSQSANPGRVGAESLRNKKISVIGANKINSYDVGFMLGIMRGPGNDAGVEYFDKNFDGENNERVAFTSTNYAFTSDSIDNCNRDFDYNGDAADGVDYNGRFSLKLRAGKYDKDGNPIKDADGNPIIIQDSNRANRGLYDKFWKEYAYFTVNKKILRITCRMEIADIVAIDWTKRYRIGEHVGFIANYSYSVSTDGMSDVEMDLYYI